MPSSSCAPIRESDSFLLAAFQPGIAVLLSHSALLLDFLLVNLEGYA